MKRSTENSLMQRTRKIITLMLTITVAVGLLPLVCTTVDAATYELPYILALTDPDGNTTVYAADGMFVLLSDTSNATSQSAIEGIRAINASCMVSIVYSTALSEWVTDEIFAPSTLSAVQYRYGTSTKYAKATPYVSVGNGNGSSTTPFAGYSVVTNVSWNSYEKAAFGGYSNDLTQLPQGITEDAIRDIIDEQLNTMSESGNTATTIINNTTVQYNSYQAGDITSEEMQSYVTSNLDTLSDLTPSTLLDAMQINNALTYNQTIQDELLNTSSDTIAAKLSQALTRCNTVVNNYIQGASDQKTATQEIRYKILEVSRLLTDGTATTAADIAAVNAAINAMQAHLDQVTGYNDLSQDSSDKSQASDQAELDYLDELTAETTATVEQLAPSQNFSSSQTGEAQEVFNLIWENEFVKKLLPMCAGFMVVCVVLGIRYKV